MDTRVIAVVSGKGGTGASLVAASLACAFARQGKKTLAVDLDRASSLAFALGLRDRALFDLSSFFEGKIGADRLLVADDRLPGLYLAPSPEDRGFLREPLWRQKLKKLAADGGFERVVVDLPDTVFACQEFPADLFLLVTTQDPASLYACEELAGRLLAANRAVRLIVNRFDLTDPASYKKDRTSVLGIIDAIHVQLIGVVPENYALLRRGEEGTLSSSYLREADAPFDNIAARINGGAVPLFEGAGGERLRKKL